ncbi:hypothetical protein OS493_000634 [Desmophyllum pertusum]|uniref:Uncharacterized protein n=1 Tax=Desmophyllum pertusum TaxID=174260 RepID=A0A9X0DCE2_9CNID|nr:hypothetical protein OS493_000634 [Desmophyllum pertusum]
MELLKDYASDSSSDNSETETKAVGEKEVRSVYLVTYSQADIEKFSFRRDFATAVVQSFSTGRARVIQWCCCRKEHKKSGGHYHIALKLDRNQRWIAAIEFLRKEYGISVHFSNRHHNYYSAWRYLTKCDKYVQESDGHPDLRNSTKPWTSEASRTRQLRKRPREVMDDDECSEIEDECADGDDTNMSSKSGKSKRKKRLTAYEVSEIIIQKGVKDLTELQALAYGQKQEGKTDLAQFLISRAPRVVVDILNSAWKIETAQQKLARSKKTRMELLQEGRNGECIEGCNGEWLTCAQEILQNNSVPSHSIENSVVDILMRPRKIVEADLIQEDVAERNEVPAAVVEGNKFPVAVVEGNKVSVAVDEEIVGPLENNNSNAEFVYVEVVNYVDVGTQTEPFTPAFTYPTVDTTFVTMSPGSKRQLAEQDHRYCKKKLDPIPERTESSIHPTDAVMKDEPSDDSDVHCTKSWICLIFDSRQSQRCGSKATFRAVVSDDEWDDRDDDTDYDSDTSDEDWISESEELDSDKTLKTFRIPTLTGSKREKK